ncbi:zinc-binding alcohol dehydrogenase family protein [Polymorphobacter megasporae]|uniref:zinc-binding alcohol dehydrogenase family protein n=1 Tax=Glacieibacterium megasporae TaxID=2835787 RepID=UPI001C1E4C30|nr:zinc-binding alcohol dehydrogenase family protein [Polymorphobacter megasporae]UAJ10653.1 zinc-binding alcohol dehydrogenase family protein [Polymorphobacter megasporae]
MKDNTNSAAWQPKVGTPLEVGPAEMPVPRENEILVRNRAIAINPVDWILQDNAIFPWLDYPAILGSDVAGEVAAIGSGVTGFKVGDRVLGQSVGATTNQPTHGAFQAFTLIMANMAATIPASMTFEDAAVIPLGLGTAACGLFQKDQLGLHHPSLSPHQTGETVLVWGGSSSVGCNAIQLAVAAGYDCVTTASPRNRQLLTDLGASHVFDHADPGVVEAIVEALRGKTLAGALHATGDMVASFAVVSRCQGRKFVSTTLPPPEGRAEGVETNHISGTSLKDNEVSRAVYRDFLSPALAAGRFQPAPSPDVVGSGLEALQGALQVQKASVSGQKIVITIDE